MLGESFSMHNGGRLSVYDLFSSLEPDAVDELLCALALEQAQLKMQGNPDLFYDNLPENLMNTFDPLNFAMTENSLSLLWQTYSLGPYVSGSFRFDIPYSQIADKINTEYLP